MKLHLVCFAAVLTAANMACTTVNPIPVPPDARHDVTFVNTGYMAGGRGSALVGRVYVLEGTFGGEAASYIGATARELRARFSTHQWKELKDEAEALWGYVNPLGDWVPGLLRRSLPAVTADPYNL